MNQKLASLRGRVSNLLLDARSVEHLVRQDEFASMYERASADFQQQIDELCRGALHTEQRIRLESIATLKELLRIERQGDVSIRDLREEARNLGIPKYSRMDKAQLLSAITNKRNVSNGRKFCPENLAPESDSISILGNSSGAGILGDEPLVLHIQEGEARSCG